MLILGFDTATPWGTMALGDETDTIFEISLKSGKGGGEYLLSILSRLLVKSGKSLDEVGLIAAGTGPGSYTGIRVGLAAVRGLAEGLKIPVMGVDTLRIIAENGYRAGDLVAAVIDAKRGWVYTALYQNSAQGLKEYWPPCYSEVEGFAKRLASLKEVLICGDGGKKYRETWESSSLVQIGPSAWDRPSAANLVRIAAQRRLADHKDQNQDLSPCYLRKVEAVARLEERMNADRSCSDEIRRLK